MKDNVYTEVVKEWERWPSTKHLTDAFAFNDLLKAAYGITISGRNKSTFKYSVDDEQKFAWFLLGGRVK